MGADRLARAGLNNGHKSLIVVVVVIVVVVYSSPRDFYAAEGVKIATLTSREDNRNGCITVSCLLLAKDHFRVIAIQQIAFSEVHLLGCGGRL